MLDRLAAPSLSLPLPSLEPTESTDSLAGVSSPETVSGGESAVALSPSPEQPSADPATTLADWGQQYLRQWFPAQLDARTVSTELPAPVSTARTEATSAASMTSSMSPSEKAARQAIADAAQQAAGLGAHNRKEEYLDFLAGPNDKGQLRQDMLSMSSCGLFARAALRQAGVQDALLDRPYNPNEGSNVISELQTAARSKDAWVNEPRFDRDKVTTEQLPKTGDVVLIHDAAKGTHDHVLVLTSDPIPDPQHPGDFLVNTAEGGQGNYTKKSDRTDAFGTLAGSAPVGQEEHVNPPRRMRVDDQGRLRMVKGNETLGRAVYGWADAGKMMRPSHA